jgi:signal transduction histidine kinase/CheY-like chemotaxis protein
VVDITRRKHAEEITHRRTEELETLMMVSTAMRTARTRLEISQVILDQLTTILESQAAALTLLDSGSGEILVELGYGDWRDWTGTRLAANQPGMVCPLASMQPYQHRGASDSIPSLHPQLTNKLPCVTSVPLIANEQPIGALWIGRTSPFAQENMQLLEAIRDMAANAIQRQTLNENLQTQLEALRSMQARLVQNEKLAAVGQLVSGVAHELNNPLTSVMLYSQMAQHTELDELTRQNLTKVVSEARRAGKIVRGLLDFARQRPPRRETIQVNEVLRLSLDLVAYELRAHNIELEVHLSPDLPKISADPHQLQQVFVNLIQNAWHAMDLAWGGGHLTIWTEVGRSKFWTSPDQAGQMVRVCVKDDGPGIAPENISRIFDPFFTTMPEGSGTGLGLSICHGIITEHAGYIWAESPAGQGASLFIELPVGAAPQAAVSESSSATDLLDSSTEKYRILVMDDEPNISAVLAQALQRAEYLVDAVSSGTEGLSRIKDLEYDAIVCDIRMPGFSGLDFYREVEKHDPRLLDRIIFITGDTVNSATRKFIEEKRARYLAKPFEMGDLFNIIKTVLAS